MRGSDRSPAMGLGRATATIGLLVLGGCSIFRPAPPPAPVEPPKPRLAEPLAMHTFPFDPRTTGVVGELQVTFSRHEDTLPDIARTGVDLISTSALNSCLILSSWIFPGLWLFPVYPRFQFSRGLRPQSFRNETQERA